MSSGMEEAADRMLLAEVLQHLVDFGYLSGAAEGIARQVIDRGTGKPCRQSGRCLRVVR